MGNADLSGFSVEAIDESIGKIDEASNDVGASRTVVDWPLDFWQEGHAPGGCDPVDANDETVDVDRMKDQIKAAPEYDDSLLADERYRGELGSYYGALDSGIATRDAPADPMLEGWERVERPALKLARDDSESDRPRPTT